MLPDDATEPVAGLRTLTATAGPSGSGTPCRAPLRPPRGTEPNAVPAD